MVLLEEYTRRLGTLQKHRIFMKTFGVREADSEAYAWITVPATIRIPFVGSFLCLLGGDKNARKAIEGCSRHVVGPSLIGKIASACA